MAYKSGWLQKKSKSLFKFEGDWVRRFYVLTNIGLIYMKNPTDRDVKLYPSLDFDVKGVSFEGTRNSFVLKTIKNNEEMLIQTANKE